VLRNTILGTKRYHGIAVERNTRRVSLRDNAVVRASWCGICIIKACTLSIANNAVDSSIHEGVFVTKCGYGGSDLYVFANSLKYNGGCGLTLENATNCAIVGNEISGNKYAGILISSGNDLFIANNLMRDNGESGTSVMRSGLLLEGYSSGWNPCGQYWHNLFINSNRFEKGTYQDRTITLDNGDYYRVSNNTCSGYSGEHFYYANTGTNRTIVDNWQ
jgi:parallel beta-helix repeat protein